MIARMLQVMYCGEYGTHFYEVLLPIVMENSLSNKKASGVTKTDVEPPSFKVRMQLITTYAPNFKAHTPNSHDQVHALLYAMGDRYQFPTLVDLARTKFIASMNEPGFTLDDLVTAIDVVYSTTIDTDDRLRKHVVYRAQCYMQELKNLDNFKEVYEKYVGFSWDFGLNYRHCKTVWCAACGANSKLPSACLCGFHGLCQNLKLCNELDWSGLKCTSCKRVGQLLREEPRDDEGVQFTGMGKSKSLPNSPNGATSPRKKRKSM